MRRIAFLYLLIASPVGLGFWFSLPAKARSLPALSASVGSNLTMHVSWPYSSLGFSLQQATQLEAVATWRSSSVMPAFDPGSVRFFFSAPASDPAGFFRLAVAADLRGIYVYSSDVATLSSNYAKTLTTSLGVTGVDGLVLVIGWDALEPANGQFNWAKLDQWMNQAMALGKNIDLAILSGQNTPAWLFQPVTSGGAAAHPLNFTISPHQGATGNCITETIAAPWDPAFLDAWNSLLANLSTHLKNNGAYRHLALLRLTGINRTTDELRLPAETASGTGLDCVSDAPALWQAAGYTPALLLQGWSNMLNSFQASFPDKSFSVAIIPNNAFPPIDDNGQIITNQIPDANQPLLTLASQRFAGRLVVQFNYLMTGQGASVAVIQAAQNLGTQAAFQSNNYLGASGGGAACGGTVVNPVSCTSESYLAELQAGIYPLTQTNILRALYIEVFPANVIAFTNAIWQAHAELFTPP